MRNIARAQRGVAAVEFALTAPLFLLLLGGMMGLSIALYSKFIITNAANVAVRACVISQAGAKTTGEFNSCAERFFPTLVGGSGLPFQCSSLQARTQGDIPVVTSPIDTRNNVHLLSLTVSCGINVGGLINMGGYGGGGSSAPLTVSAAAAMPYTLFN